MSIENGLTCSEVEITKTKGGGKMEKAAMVKYLEEYIEELENKKLEFEKEKLKLESRLIYVTKKIEEQKHELSERK